MSACLLAPTGYGVFNDEMIADLIDEGKLEGVDKKHIQPSSVDLAPDLSREVIRLGGSFRPQEHESVTELLKKVRWDPWDSRIALERQVNYLVPLKARLKLYNDTYGYANPKSSSGRSFLSTELIANGTTMYNHIHYGYDGEVYAVIMPRSYPVKLAESEPLCQLRFFNADSRLNRDQLSRIFDQHQLIWVPDGQLEIGVDETHSRQPVSFEELCARNRIDKDGRVSLTLFIGKNGFAGWRWTGHSLPVDMAARDVCAEDYWQPVYANSNGYVHIRAGEFYILSSYEYVSTPYELCWELKDIDTRYGPARWHDAGFGDSGFGVFLGEMFQGSRVTFETSTPQDVWIRAGDVVGSVRFEHMIRPPHNPYTGNYSKQELPKLAKQFKLAV